MVARRVFVLWTHTLFRDSVRQLLSHPEVEWVGETQDYASAWDEIEELHPDTVLVEETDDHSSGETVEILKHSSWNVYVVGLNLSNNDLRVYHREQRTVKDSNDLLDLVLASTGSGEVEGGSVEVDRDE